MSDAQGPTAGSAPENEAPAYQHPVSLEQFESLVGRTMILESGCHSGRQEVTLREVRRRSADDRPAGLPQPFDVILEGPAHGMQETGPYNLKTKTGQGDKLKANGVFVQCQAGVPLQEGDPGDRIAYVVSFN